MSFSKRPQHFFEVAKRIHSGWSYNMLAPGDPVSTIGALSLSKKQEDSRLIFRIAGATAVIFKFLYSFYAAG